MVEVRTVTVVAASTLVLRDLSIIGPLKFRPILQCCMADNAQLSSQRGRDAAVLIDETGEKLLGHPQSLR
jgi:hypothetical protein